MEIIEIILVKLELNQEIKISFRIISTRSTIRDEIKEKMHKYKVVCAQDITKHGCK